jgi:2-desacetyl-2-hydroxyethyl bacteriochlorophyllide A dehydrogenase
MKALFLDKPGHIAIREIKKPKPLPDQALIEVRYCGICGSDIGAYRGVNPTVEYPILIGHEPVGIIREIEENQYGLKPGDRIVVEPFTFCGTCPMCRIGRYNNCLNMKTMGTQIPGAMTMFIAHNNRQLFKVPDGILDIHAVMVEPLTIPLHAIRRVRVQKGEAVLITGAGTIGILASMACMAYGALPILTDPLESRLALARRLGIEHTFNNSVGTDLKNYIQEVNGGAPADVILECSGATEVLEKLTDYIGFGGRIVFVGWPKEPITFNTFWVSRKEINIYGSRNSCNCFSEAIDLINTGKVNAGALISRTIKLSDMPDLMPDIVAHPNTYLKAVVDLT